jgi:hypothetical protein
MAIGEAAVRAAANKAVFKSLDTIKLLQIMGKAARTKNGPRTNPLKPAVPTAY